MTVEAAARRATESDRGLMAAVALRSLVAALELEVRKRVIECLAVELDDVGSAPFVVGVAIPALLAEGVGLAAVEAFSLLAIGAHVLVTRNTKQGL